MNIVKAKKAYLKTPLSTSASSVVLRSLVDSKDNDLTLADFGTWGVIVIKQGDTIEMIKFDAISIPVAGSTATLTVATNGRNLNPTSPYAGSSTGNAFSSGAEVIVTNDPLTLSQFGNINNANTWALLQTFTVAPVSSADAVDSTELVRKSQLDSAVLGTLSSAPIVVPANAGETVEVDQVVYLKASDSEWYLADADTANNVENVILGVTRGAGTDGASITNGVTLLGEHIASSAIFTANTAYFASNTAGGWATSAGTKEVSLGIARTTTKIYFSPRYNQQITENQQDLIEQIEAGTDWYQASSVGTDSYAITITPAITAYTAGMKFRFKADVANTGACTLNVSTLGAKTIKKLNDQDLATGDIEAGQIVEVVFDGTNMQMVSPHSLITPAVDIQTFTSSDSWSKPANAKLVEVILIGAGGGGGGGATGQAGYSGGGGGGGGGGALTKKIFNASALSATEAIAIGAGGAGGAGGLTGTNDGSDGSAGGATTFGTTVILGAGGGLGGGGGTSNPNNAGTAGAGGTGSGDVHQTGGAGGAGTAVGVSSSTDVSPRGGGGGRFGDASNGAVGGGFTTYYTLAGGAVGTIGNSPTSGLIYGGTGGGGSNVNAGAGGAGGNYGAGGGGGGARNAGEAGAGGDGGAGANGLSIVITYF